jgi:uncharacterized SAM-binding protein YcdF (DUF218 family)
MPEEKRALEQLVLARAVHLNATVQGIVIGLVAGLGVFIATNWLVLKGGEVVGPHLALLGQFLPGYHVSFVGSLVGFAYGLAWGYLVGYVVARIYNWGAQRRERKRLGHV